MNEDVNQLTVFVHGVWSNGGGFRPVVEDCRKDSSFPFQEHRIKLYDHGYTMPWEPWSEGNRKKLSDAIGGYLHKQVRKYPFLEQINVIAHSYGTYGVSNYLLNCESAELSIDNLVLLNSVVPKDFPWEFVIDSKNMVSDVLNIMADLDPVPILGPLVNLGTSGDRLFHKLFGYSGGFNTNSDRLYNIGVNGGHSWYRTDRGRKVLRSFVRKLSGSRQGAWEE